MIIKIQNVFMLKITTHGLGKQRKIQKIGDACHIHGLEESILAA